jgi:RNA polymerase sigma factor for flagellar operon FliA
LGGQQVVGEERSREDAEEDEARLWAAWREARDLAARERLVLRHLDFARIMAGKLYARRATDEIGFDEYLQLASMGLLEAVDRYDPQLGASFRTYAGHRIQGAILSGLEALTERQRQIALKRRIAQERLESIKAEGDAAPADAFLRLASIAVGLALGFMLDDASLYQSEEGTYGDNTYTACEARQIQQRLYKLAKELPERESRIIVHHYFQQVPFDEIASTLGVTKGRVSQIHKRAITMLREALRGDGGVDLAL